jgi:hypothetical protein
MTSTPLPGQEAVSSHHETGPAPFSPIFIVGAPRSGTTMLAVLLGRHKNIAMPPETLFFTDFLPQAMASSLETRQQKVGAALAHHRVKDLGLAPEEVLPIFEQHENTFENLFQSLLEAYARRKGAGRAGEKTPKHIEHVPHLLRAFPEAKVVCIVRDGRDVVLSLLKVPWAEPDNPRRFGLFCTEWNEHARMALDYQKSLPSSQFCLVRYEDILREPESNLKALCSFIGEPYDQDLLNPERGADAVPHWESGWKAKAAEALDPARIEAWRRHPDQKLIWRLNAMMGDELRRFRYPETASPGCPLHLRLTHQLQNLPYAPGMRPLSLAGLRLLRRLGLVQ